MRKPTLLSDAAIDAWVADHPPDGISQLSDALMLGVLSDIEAEHVRRWLLRERGLVEPTDGRLAKLDWAQASALHWDVVAVLAVVALLCLGAWLLLGERLA